jgi:hypothetical protein
VDTVGLLVTPEAKPGKQDELATSLTGALPLVQQEPETTAWFAIRLSPARSAFSTHSPATRRPPLRPSCHNRIQAAPQLLAEDPSIDKVDILAEKSPLINQVTRLNGSREPGRR